MILIQVISEQVLQGLLRLFLVIFVKVCAHFRTWLRRRASVCGTGSSRDELRHYQSVRWAPNRCDLGQGRDGCGRQPSSLSGSRDALSRCPSITEAQRRPFATMFPVVWSSDSQNNEVTCTRHERKTTVHTIPWSMSTRPVTKVLWVVLNTLWHLSSTKVVPICNPNKKIGKQDSRAAKTRVFVCRASIERRATVWLERKVLWNMKTGLLLSLCIVVCFSVVFGQEEEVCSFDHPLVGTTAELENFSHGVWWLLLFRTSSCGWYRSQKADSS